MKMLTGFADSEHFQQTDMTKVDIMWDWRTQ